MHPELLPDLLQITTSFCHRRQPGPGSGRQPAVHDELDPGVSPLARREVPALPRPVDRAHEVQLLRHRVAQYPAGDALSAYMGHANISITMDRYGHLMPGNEDEKAGLHGTYLTRACAG